MSVRGIKIVAARTPCADGEGLVSTLSCYRPWDLGGSSSWWGLGEERRTQASGHSFPNTIPGLPWWRSGEESSCQCRGHRFEPWSGKIPHAVEQLSPCAATTEPMLWSPRTTTTEAHVPQLLQPLHLEPVLRNKRSHCSEKPTHRNEE